MSTAVNPKGQEVCCNCGKRSLMVICDECYRKYVKPAQLAVTNEKVSPEFFWKEEQCESC